MKPSEDDLRESLDKANMPADLPVLDAPAIPDVAQELDPKAYKPAPKQVLVEDDFKIKPAFKFAFLGSGQGGGRIAASFYDLGYRRVAAFNTTDQDFGDLPAAIPRLSLDTGGAGKDPSLAAGALKTRHEDVWDLFTRSWGFDIDYAFICASLGGGTGSGTAPQLVEIARKFMEAHDRPVHVGAIVSLPRPGDGPWYARNAVHGFRALLNLGVSPILIIDNTRINELYKPDAVSLYPVANQTIAKLFHVFNQLAGIRSGLVTFDRSEFAQLLDNRVLTMGSAVFNVKDIKSPADISSQIRDRLAGNVLAQVDLSTGTAATCLFVGPTTALQSFSIDYFDAGFDQLNRLLNTSKRKEPAVVHRGIYPSSASPASQQAAERFQCYVMIAGLDPPYARLAALAKAGSVDDAITTRNMAQYLGVQD